MNHGERGGAKPTPDIDVAREDSARAVSRLAQVGAELRTRRTAELVGLDKQVGALVEACGSLAKAEEARGEEQTLAEVRLTEAVRSNLTRLADAVEMARQSLQQQLDLASAKLVESEKLRSDLSSACHVAEQAAELASGDLLRTQEARRLLQQQLDVLSPKLVESDKERAAVTSACRAAEQAAERANKELERTRRELERASKQLEASLDDITSAMLTQASLQEAVAAATEQRDKAIARCEQLQRTIDEKRSEHEARVTALGAELEQARSDGLQSSAEVDSTQVHVRALTEQLEQLGIDLESLRQERDRIKGEASQSARKHHDELDGLIDAHRDQLDLMTAGQASEAARVAARERESQEMIVTLNKKVDEASRASLKLMHDRDVTRKQVEELTAERDRQMQESCKTIATLTAQLAESRSALEQASSDALAGFTGEMEELREQVRVLMLELARERDQSERQRSELEFANRRPSKPASKSIDIPADADQVGKREAVTAPPPSRRASRKPPPSKRSVQIAAAPDSAPPSPIPSRSPGVYRMTAVDIRDETTASRDGTPTEPPRGAGKKRKR